MKIHSIEPGPISFVPHLSAAPGGGMRKSGLPLLRGWVSGMPKQLEALFVASDLQGRDLSGQRLLGEAVAEHLVSLASAAVIPATDRIGILLCGDLYAKPDPVKRGGLGDVGSVWAAFAEHFRWVLGVLGNHDILDPGSLAPFANKAQVLDGNESHRDGLVLAGVSGIVGDPKRPNRKSEEKYLEHLLKALNHTPDILVIHPCPWVEGPEYAGLRTQRGGEGTLLDAVGLAENLLVTCGHMHWENPVAKISEGVQILNVDGRGVLLLPIPDERI